MNIIKLTMSLIKSGLSEQKTLSNEDVIKASENLETIYRLSKSHDLAHLVALGIKYNNVVCSDKLNEKFKSQLNIAIFRYENQKEVLENFFAFLEREKIDYLPLKGYFIRPFYKNEFLRQSCDIDVLIRDKDRQKVYNAISKCYKIKPLEVSSHDVAYSINNVRIELHHFFSEGYKIDREYVEKIFDRAVKVENSCRYTMTNEEFLLFFFEHIVKHFYYGGCGIKPFVDMFVMQDFINQNRKKLLPLLEKFKLDKFFNYCEKLTNYWFNDKESDEFVFEMEKYILSGGVYGTVENSVMTQQVVKGDKKRAVSSRIWLPYEQLKMRYPMAKNKFLVPFYQFKRWCNLFKKGKIKNSVKELKENNLVDNSKKEKIEKLFNELNIK